ncbi:putative c-x8-c-x5-c-x3-h type zinc finger protein [Diaporthe ampelina]|uniref:Putative c-x8-c-x5-c-x3-h type zinc finger protein n=1 Tax=Diaporthe ampelina TaxID=1214573 RepID=A0A0G2F4T5_9PEZI|nr:putative c-x8-c-x5-c-x3-h type zinc finger protein [Diaporthe ampelina]
MEGLAEPEAFKACYAQFRQSDNDRDVLITQLLSNYEDLQIRYRNVMNQLQDEKENREIWQRQTRDARKQLTQSKLANESHPFVVMIIDGDGAKFRDDYFRAGDNGGGQAAQQLKTQIKLQLQENYPDTSTDNWNIMVFFYANMDGLGKALAARRILDTWTDLQKFASGFGRANSLFSFVDVGYGKDKADHKCQAMLKQMLHATSCRHVFFGPCRDNGYLNLLEEYKHDPIKREKLTLVSTEPAGPGFVNLGFTIVTFPSVFRSEPMDNISNARYPMSPVSPIGLDIGIQPFPPAPGSNYPGQYAMSEEGSNGSAPSVSNGNGSVNGSTNGGGSTWAVTAKLSNGPVIDIYNKQKPLPKLKYVLFNAANLRVDERLPAADPTAIRSLENKARTQGCNFCNHYHLTGSCDKNEHSVV